MEDWETFEYFDLTGLDELDEAIGSLKAGSGMSAVVDGLWGLV
jgi:hypothetical protein